MRLDAKQQLLANGRAADQSARATIYSKDKFGKDENLLGLGKKQARISEMCAAIVVVFYLQLAGLLICYSTACMW